MGGAGILRIADRADALRQLFLRRHEFAVPAVVADRARQRLLLPARQPAHGARHLRREPRGVPRGMEAWRRIAAAAAGRAAHQCRPGVGDHRHDVYGRHRDLLRHVARLRVDPRPRGRPPPAHRRAAAGGARGRRARQPREVAVSGAHEPRAAHAAQRGHRLQRDPEGGRRIRRRRGARHRSRPHQHRGAPSVVAGQRDSRHFEHRGQSHVAADGEVQRRERRSPRSP